MTSYAVARLDEIEELTDGREPFRPVRHHFGITSFGVNAWTAPEVGDRIINEHDESDPDSDEELYLVVRGRAMFELDGDRVAAPTGTFVFAPPGVKRTAFAEEPETTVIALGGTPGKAYEPDGWELWAPLTPLYAAAASATSAGAGLMRGARTAATSRLRTARPAATSIPRWKPAASASGWVIPLATASVTREVAAVETSASPTAPPTWNAVVTMPDAAPASSCGTSATAAIWLLTPTSGRPRPNTIRPGRMSAA